MKLRLFTLVMLMAMAQTAFAGGCFPGDPCYDKPVVRKERVIVPAPKRMIEKPMAKKIVEPVAAVEDECCWSSTLGIGVPVYLFDEEDTDAGGGLYANFTRCNLNLRVGAEVSHIDLDQPSAQTSAEFAGRRVDLTYVRIPLAVEYVVPLAEDTNVFLGGGPDLIATANDISEFSVGAHLGARVAHDITEKVGVALEAGYMWGEIDSENGGGDVDLNGTYITPSVYYRF